MRTAQPQHDALSLVDTVKHTVLESPEGSHRRSNACRCCIRSWRQSGRSASLHVRKGLWRGSLCARRRRTGIASFHGCCLRLAAVVQLTRQSAALMHGSARPFAGGRRQNGLKSLVRREFWSSSAIRTASPKRLEARPRQVDGACTLAETKVNALEKLRDELAKRVLWSLFELAMG